VSLMRKIQARTERRKLRVRSRLKESTLPRVSVFRSLKHIYAQLIDDAVHKTLASCSTVEFEKVTGDKKQQAHAVGLALAKKAQEAGVKAAVFDRGSFHYHGRLKALSEGLREGGLKI
jgi:large subunit ribosomal protein L18